MENRMSENVQDEIVDFNTTVMESCWEELAARKQTLVEAKIQS